jgi:hypothetical protein
MPQIALFVVIIATFLVGGGFFVKGALYEKDPRQRIKLSLYGAAFMLLGYLGNHFLAGGTL